MILEQIKDFYTCFLFTLWVGHGFLKKKISVYTYCPDIIINSGLYHFQKYFCLDNRLCGCPSIGNYSKTRRKILRYRNMGKELYLGSGE